MNPKSQNQAIVYNFEPLMFLLPDPEIAKKIVEKDRREGKIRAVLLCPDDLDSRYEKILKEWSAKNGL